MLKAKKSKKQILSESEEEVSGSDSSSEEDDDLLELERQIRRKKKLKALKRQKKSKKITQEVTRPDGSKAKRRVTKDVKKEEDDEVEPLKMITSGDQLTKMRGGTTHLTKEELPCDTLFQIMHIKNLEMKNSVLAVYCDIKAICQS